MKYNVHSCQKARVPVEVKLPDGTPAEASVEAYVIELTPGEPYGRTLTIVETPKTPEQVAALTALFEVGKAVEISFKPAA